MLRCVLLAALAHAASGKRRRRTLGEHPTPDESKPDLAARLRAGEGTPATECEACVHLAAEAAAYARVCVRARLAGDEPPNATTFARRLEDEVCVSKAWPWCERWRGRGGFRSFGAEMVELSADAEDDRDSALSRSSVQALCAHDGPLRACPRTHRFVDRNDPAAADVAFLNRTPQRVDVYWLRGGERVHRGTMRPHGRLDEDSFAGHTYEAAIGSRNVGQIQLAAGVAVYSVDGYGNDIYMLNAADARERGKEF
jgi:hypothetical protein